MYGHRKWFILTALPTSARCPLDILHFIRMWITILIISARPPPAHFLPTNREYWWKRQCMEWRGYIYFTCKQPIFIYWNYRWDFRKFDRYRSWSSRIISSHCWSTPHSIIQKYSYCFRFMAKIIPVIPYAISTFWNKRSNI